MRYRRRSPEIRGESSLSVRFLILVMLLAAGWAHADQVGGHPAEETIPKGEASLRADRAVEPEARGDEEEEVLKGAILEKTAEAPSPDQAPPPGAAPPSEPSRSLLWYASLRLNLNYDGDDSPEFTDGASRIGVFGVYQTGSNAALLGRIELGFNVVDELSLLVTPDASPAEGRAGTVFTPRLYYGGYEQAGSKLIVGKNWSTYYTVAGLTDRFPAGGGRAAGVYNARTDGGGSGTGRADHVGQIRGNLRQWTYGLQGQIGAPMPVFTDDRFDFGLGGALLRKTSLGLAFGAAYNHAVPEQVTQDMRDQGLSGDDTSLAFGLRFRGDRTYVAATYAVSRNHEADDEDMFFDAEGWEVFGRQDLRRNLRTVAGLNVLRPDDENYEGAFRIEQYIVGLQYAFGEATYDDMIYVEYSFDEGRRANGEAIDHRLTLGLRWGWAY